MAHVITASNQGSTDTIDVTFDTGSTSDRKAIAHLVAQAGETSVSTTAVRDPGGADEAMTAVYTSEVINSGDAVYLIHSYRLDLSVTGSQTFRFAVSAASVPKIDAVVTVWDDLASGAPEASETTQFTGGATSISDSITTVTDGAVLFTGCVMRASAVDSAPFFTPDNSQTERVDTLNSNRLGIAVGDLVVSTAGAQTMGWTADATCDVGIQNLLAFAPAAGGTAVPVFAHQYKMRRG